MLRSFEVPRSNSSRRAFLFVAVVVALSSYVRVSKRESEERDGEGASPRGTDTYIIHNAGKYNKREKAVVVAAVDRSSVRHKRVVGFCSVAGAGAVLAGGSRPAHVPSRPRGLGAFAQFSCFFGLVPVWFCSASVRFCSASVRFCLASVRICSASVRAVLLTFRAVLLSFRAVLLSFRAVSLGNPRVVAGESARLCANSRRFSWLPCVLCVHYRASGSTRKEPAPRITGKGAQGQRNRRGAKH